MMGKIKIVFAIAVVLLLATALPAAAGKGGGGKSGSNGGGGKLSATIDVADATAAGIGGSGSMMFDVTRSLVDNRETMYVTNTCRDAEGNVVSDLDQAVLWGTWDSLDGIAGPFATDGVECTAYATMRPWQDRPMSGAVITYTP